MNKEISFIGDSLTLNYIWGVLVHDYYPTVLQRLFEAENKIVLCRNFGVSGDTTTQMLARDYMLTRYGIPNVAIIFGGHNDLSSGISTATTTSNIKAMATKLLNLGCKVVICSIHYQNFSTGGDSTATPQGARLDLYNAQKAVVTDLAVGTNANNIIFCDFYAGMRALINSGDVTQGDWTEWFVSDSNTHLNTNGQSILASIIYENIKTITVW